MGNKYIISVALVVLLVVFCFGDITHSITVRNADTHEIYYQGSGDGVAYIPSETTRYEVETCCDGGSYYRKRIGLAGTTYQIVIGGGCFGFGYVSKFSDPNPMIGVAITDGLDKTTLIQYVEIICGEPPPPTMQILGNPEVGFSIPPSDGSVIEINEDTSTSWGGYFCVKEGWNFSGSSYDDSVFKNVSVIGMGDNNYRYHFNIDKGNMEDANNYIISFNAISEGEPATETSNEGFGDLEFEYTDGSTPTDVTLGGENLNGEWQYVDPIFGSPYWGYFVDGNLWYLFYPDKERGSGRLLIRHDTELSNDASGTLETGGNPIIYVDEDGNLWGSNGGLIGSYTDEATELGGYKYYSYITINGNNYGVDYDGNVHWVPGERSETFVYPDVPPEYTDDTLLGDVRRFIRDMFITDDYECWEDMKDYMAGKFPFSVFYTLGQATYTFISGDDDVNIEFDMSMFHDEAEEKVNIAGDWLNSLSSISRPFSRWVFTTLFIIFLVRKFMPQMVFK